MGLFFSKPKNRRRRRVFKRPERDWIQSPSQDAGARSQRGRGTRQRASVVEETAVHQLSAQIGVIETFLAKHHRAEVERARMRDENILPPIDPARHRRAKHAVCLAAKRRELAERNRTSFRFLMLFAVASALLWWLATGSI